MPDFRWFAPGPLPKYPGMGLMDAFIMDQYLKSKPSGLIRASYNVAVGSGRPFDSKSAGMLSSDWTFLTSLKADAVLEFEDHFEIMEVKPDAGPGAIGQLQCYSILLRQEFAPGKPIYSVILTDSIHPDVEKCAGILNVRVKIVKSPISA